MSAKSNFCLTEGALRSMVDGPMDRIVVPLNRPTVQIVDWIVADKKVFKQLVGKQQRWKVLLNDGTHHFNRVMLSEELNRHFQYAKIPQFSIIAIDKYECVSQELKGSAGVKRKALKIIDATIKIPGGQVREIIGNPTRLEDVLEGETPLCVERPKSYMYLCVLDGWGLTPGKFYQELTVDDKLQYKEWVVDPDTKEAKPGANAPQDVAMDDSSRQRNTYLHGPLGEPQVAWYCLAPSDTERLKRYYFHKLLHKFDLLDLGQVVRFRQGEHEYSGIVRWKNQIPNARDLRNFDEEQMRIGVQLSPKYAGKGNSNGVYEGSRHFSCRKNCAVFVPFKCIIDEQENLTPLPSSVSYCSTDQDVMDAVRKVPFPSRPGDDVNIVQTNNSRAKALSTADPSAGFVKVTYPIFFITISEGMIEVYGMQKHLQNIDAVKKLPDVLLCNYDADRNLCTLAAKPEVTNRLRQYLELVRAQVKLQSQHIEHFRRAGSTKGISDASRCAICFDERSGSLVLRGLASEINAAKLLLDELIASFNNTKAAKKSKPKTKKINGKTCDINPASTKELVSKPTNILKDEPFVKSATGKDLGKALQVKVYDASTPSPVAGSVEMVSSTETDVKTFAKPTNNDGVVIESEHTEVPVQGPLQEDHQAVDCVVCLVEPPTVAFIPCGHRHTCSPCAKKIFESDSRCCPTCREQIERCYRIWT